MARAHSRRSRSRSASPHDGEMTDASPYRGPCRKRSPLYDSDDPDTWSEVEIDEDEVEMPRHVKPILTVGFELEMGIAVCPLQRGAPDPHEEDGRWLVPNRDWSTPFQSPMWDAAKEKLIEVLRGIDGIVARDQIQLWKDEMSGIRLETALDPQAIYIPDMEAKYTCWGSTEDTTVSSNDLKYLYFGGEVVSPPLDANNHPVLDTLTKITDALRSKLRIRKPAPQTGSGLHMHFGHTHGWTLDQVKRLVTLWVLIEEKLTHLHRIDRKDHTYCLPLIKGSKLGKSIQLGPRPFRLSPSDPTLPRHGPVTREAQKLNMLECVPFDDLPDGPTKDFVAQVWQYTRLGALTIAMDSHSGNTKCSLKLDLSEGPRTRRRTPHPQCPPKQTVEFRTMQGDIDPTHITAWFAVCRAIVTIARDSSAEGFKQGLSSMLKSLPETSVVDLLTQLGVHADVVGYFRTNLRDPLNGYWEYPQDAEGYKCPEDEFFVKKPEGSGPSGPSS